MIRVHGEPAPQGSKRHVGGGRLIESSKKVQPWREAVVAACAHDGTAGLRLDGPLRAECVFMLARPRGHYGAHGLRPSAPASPTVKPDVDKLLRSTLDALTAASVIADDARIVDLKGKKTYALEGEPTGARITIEEAHHE